MTSPATAAPTTTAFTANATAHLCNAPATVNANDLLVLGIGCDALPTFTTPTGFSIQCARTASGNSVSIVYVKNAAGTEGGTTIGVTTSTSVTLCAHMYRVTGWGGTIGTDIVSGTPATGSSTAPDPPSASWTWGSLDSLALEFATGNGATFTVTGYSTNYTAGTLTREATNGAAIASAKRALTAAASPEDPDALAFTVSQLWVANTVVIKGGGAVLTRNPTTSITPSVALARATAAARNPSTSITPTATAARAVTTTRNPSTSITPTAALGHVAGHPRTQATSVTPSVALSRVVDHPRTQSTSITPSVVLARAVTLVRTQTASITPLATLSRIKASLRTLATSITPAALLSRVVDHPRTQSTSITPSAVLARAVALVRTQVISITPAVTLTRSIARIRISSIFITPSAVLSIAVALVIPVVSTLVATAQQIADALSGRFSPTSLRFRYSRRTRQNALIDTLSGITEAGAITLDNSRAVVRDLTLTVDLSLMPADFNVSTDNIGVAVEVYVPPVSQWVSMQVGLFMLDASETRYHAANRLVPAKGSDLAMLLVRSVRTAAYTVVAGSNYVTAVEAIIDRHGLAHAIQATTLVVPNDLIWGPGVTDYEIARDLLFGINYFGLWADATGTMRSRHRIDPSTEPVAATYRDTAEPRMVSSRDDYVRGQDRKLLNRSVVVIDDPRHVNYGYVQWEDADPTVPNSTAALAYGAAAAISTSSAGSPTLITTVAPHGLSTGVQVLVSGHVGSTPDINGSHIVTVLSSTTFTIPIAVTVGGAGGTVQATTVQLSVWNGDATPPTKALVDTTRADEIAQFELQWGAAMSQSAQLPTFLDPRREAHEFYAVDLGGIESTQLYAVLGWRMNLAPGQIMQHSLGRAVPVALLSPPKS